MRYLLLLLFIVGCSEKLPMPQVGECYEDYFIKGKQSSYEFKKVIKVDPNNMYETITYVYNFPNSPIFKQGQWYQTIIGPSTDSKEWFLAEDVEYKVVNKIKCPW